MKPSVSSNHIFCLSKGAVWLLTVFWLETIFLKKFTSSIHSLDSKILFSPTSFLPSVLKILDLHYFFLSLLLAMSTLVPAFSFSFFFLLSPIYLQNTVSHWGKMLSNCTSVFFYTFILWFTTNVPFQHHRSTFLKSPTLNRFSLYGRIQIVIITFRCSICKPEQIGQFRITQTRS